MRTKCSDEEFIRACFMAESVEAAMKHTGYSSRGGFNQRRIDLEKEYGALPRFSKKKEPAAGDDLKAVLDKLTKAVNSPPETPAWVKGERCGSGPVVPTLFLSDFHWGEMVYGDQIGRVNTYNLEIANSRLSRVVDTAVSLLQDWTVAPNYPGIIVPLGGDMVAGYIHEELRENSDSTLVEGLFNMAEALRAAIRYLADTFGHVFLPCVVGNHGRVDRVPRYKNAAADNFDYVLYRVLDSWFRDDDRVVFLIPEGREVQWSVYGTRYLLTHGDTFSKSGGSNAISGPMGMWELTDFRKKRRQMAVGAPYDIMIFGHYHTLRWGQNWIANGSLKGYDEYAFGRNMDFEPPKQAMWITHPVYGRTRMEEIYAEAPVKEKSKPWVAVWREENV